MDLVDKDMKESSGFIFRVWVGSGVDIDDDGERGGDGGG